MHVVFRADLRSVRAREIVLKRHNVFKLMHVSSYIELHLFLAKAKDNHVLYKRDSVVYF